MREGDGPGIYLAEFMNRGQTLLWFSKNGDKLFFRFLYRGLVMTFSGF